MAKGDTRVRITFSDGTKKSVYFERECDARVYARYVNDNPAFDRVRKIEVIDCACNILEIVRG